MRRMARPRVPYCRPRDEHPLPQWDSRGNPESLVQLLLQSSSKYCSLLKSMWGRLVACGGLVTRPERRYATGAQLDKLPHNYSPTTVTPPSVTWYPLVRSASGSNPMDCNSGIFTPVFTIARRRRVQRPISTLGIRIEYSTSQ